MSSPSFELFRKPGSTKWWIRFKSIKGEIREFSSEETERAAANAVGRVRVPQKLSIARASIARWKNHNDRRRTVAEALKAEPPTPAPRSAPDREPAPEPAATVEPAPAAPEPEKRTIGTDRAAEIRAKLFGLADDSPAPPEDRADYIPPGGARADDASEVEAGENEAGELLADMIALAVVAGVTKGVATYCKRQKPPKRAAEPHETMVEWFHRGAQHNLRRAIGNAGALGPTGKMFVGCAGVIVTMLWGAEVIDGAEAPSSPRPAEAPRAAEPAPAPPPPPAPPRAPPIQPTNGARPAPQANGIRAITPTGTTEAPTDDAALGRFS